MAAYNADLRIGITGKTQLNSLEKQLGRINKDLNQINKSLKAQTLTINTKGATRALDQLDRKINKLNRSVNVNANINERRRSSGGGGGGSSAAPIAFAVSPAAVSVGKEQKRIAEALTNEEQKRLDLGRERERQIERLQNGFEEILKTRTEIGKLANQQAKLQAKADNPKTGKNATAAALFGAGTNQAQGLKKVNAELNKSRKYLDVLEDTQIDINNRVVEASRAQGKYNAKLREGVKYQERSATAAAKASKQLKKFGQGAFAGGGVAASSALSQVPILGGAASGGLVGGLTAGKAGAVGGAIAGGVTDAIGQLAAFGNQAVKTATDINRLNKSLELAAGGDYLQSLQVIRRVVEDFNAPLTDATAQFTKLYASAQGSGLALGELEDLYVGLAAGNKAFAGDAEDLNGILRAFTQIISKGTVQSEELKGQVGERLPGAFALAADALGMTTAELQKALENGEVKSAEFVRKFGRYMLQFEDKAKTIADAPVEAGARLQRAITDLENEVGQDLATLGADFQDLATIIVTELTPVIKDLIGFAKDLKAVLSPLADTANNVGEAMSNAGVGLGDFIRQVILAIPLVRELYLGVKGLVELGKALGIGQESSGIFGGLPSDYKQTELAMFARAQRFRDGQKKGKDDGLDLDLDTGSGGGGTSGPRSTLADTQLDIQLQKELLAIEKERTGLIGKNNELADFALQQRELEATLIRDLAKVDLDNLDAASKEAEKTRLQIKYQIDLVRLTNEQKQAKFELQQAFDEQVKDLELQIALEQAVTQAQRDQLQLKEKLREIDDGPLSEEQKTQLKALEVELQQARDGNQGISGYMKQLQSEVTDTEAMIVSLSQTVVSELSTAMRESVMGLIDGTKTAQEAFADMFKNIGAAFIDMATQMIAKALVMKALGILTSSSSGSNGFSGAPQMSGIPFSAGGISYEGGGYTGNGARAGGLDGRGGYMAMVHPNETVIDHNSSMSRYAGPQNSGGFGGGTFRLETQVINGVEYATVDQVREMGQIATRDGAKQGQTRTMRTLQNSRSQRAKLGMNKR